MSRLGDFVSKGVRLIVSDEEGAVSAPDLEQDAAPDPPPQRQAPPRPVREREIPAQAFQEPPPRKVVRSEVPATVADFAAVYKEAGIVLPPHGYGIDKVAEMLENKRLAPLAPELKATAVMAALEAAGVAIRDVIQDAVIRDRALDAFETAKQREVRDARASNEKRIAELTAEMDSLLKKIGAEIENLKRTSSESERAFLELQARKRQEEDRLHKVISHFVEGADNPVTKA
jgi:hypothetical protein